MGTPANDKGFTGSIPRIYETYLVPLIFEAYADDLVRRIGARKVGDLLEIAAGTGVVTRCLAARLPAETRIVATDLNQGMLDQAEAVGTSRPVEWRQADALALPFPDDAFDVVASQFGVMFFPDKVKAFAEAHRVLRPGGVFLFSVWDRIEENEIATTATDALAAHFPDDPPRFLPRTPHGYHDAAMIARDLEAGGFRTAPLFQTVTARSRAARPRDPAIGLCQGTPFRGEIEARDPTGLDRATDAVERAIAERFGNGPVDGKIQATIVTVSRA